MNKLGQQKGWVICPDEGAWEGEDFTLVAVETWLSWKCEQKRHFQSSHKTFILLIQHSLENFTGSSIATIYSGI